jgi:dihydrofolate reductase
MRELKVMSFVSLDGVAQGPGGPDEDRDDGFEHGGWAVPHFDQQLIERIGAATARAGGLLIGRRTYEEFAATWPLAEDDDPIGTTMNTMPKYVASRTLDQVSWQNSTLLTGDVVERIRDLKRGDGAEIQVHGSVGLVQTLIEHDLVDEFLLHVCPVLVGSGKRLFGAGTVPAGLRLVAATTSATGVQSCTYARDGKLQYGAMGPETGNW